MAPVLRDGVHFSLSMFSKDAVCCTALSVDLLKVQTFRVVVVHRAASNGGPATFFIWHPCTSRARLLLQQSKAHTARLITTGNYRVGVD